MGYPPVGASPIPNWWGMLIGTMCLAQLLTGVLLDRRYDRRIPLYYFTAVFYPLLYWIIMADRDDAWRRRERSCASRRTDRCDGSR